MINTILDNKVADTSPIKAWNFILPTLQMQIALEFSFLFLNFPSTVLVTTLGNSWILVWLWLIVSVTLKYEFQLELMKWLWFTQWLFGAKHIKIRTDSISCELNCITFLVSDLSKVFHIHQEIDWPHPTLAYLKYKDYVLYDHEIVQNNLHNCPLISSHCFIDCSYVRSSVL